MLLFGAPEDINQQKGIWMVETRHKKLVGKVALITGGGRGIGKAIAIEFAREGASIALTSRTEQELQSSADMLKVITPNVFWMPADVSIPTQVDHLVAQVIAHFGTLHILVNNAGVQGPIGPLAENETFDWISTIHTNLVAPFLLAKAALPAMQRQCWGKIINFSGGGAVTGRPFFSAYAVSKCALVRLTELLAEENKGYNIQVNALAPGLVNTTMIQQILSAGMQAGKIEYENVRLQLHSSSGSLELATKLAVFLASEESTPLTGKLIAAQHDNWQSWDFEHICSLTTSQWYTLRRVDEYILKNIEPMS